MWSMTQPKRLILCCDGTWNDSISTNNPLTNVARFSRCVKERTKDGILQIVYYHTGVGVGTSRISNSIDGAVWAAVLEQIIGILIWEKQSDDGPILKEYVKNLENKRHVKTGVKVKACGVWDTVSAIGVQLPVWLPLPPSKKLAHVDTRIPTCVENGFHAMALDERRSAFWPLPWSEPHDHTNFRQCWFLGAHADVGGGYEDAGLANVALIWMVAQFQHFTSLAFDVKDLLNLLVANKVVTKRKVLDASPFVGLELKGGAEITRYIAQTGKIANSFTLFWRPFGQRLRKPGTPLRTNKVQHGIGITAAKDDPGVTTISTSQNGLNAGIDVGSEQADLNSDLALGGQKPWPPQTTHDTIHFTVRALLANQYCFSRVLEKFCTVIRSGNSQQVCWQRLEEQRKGKSNNAMTKAEQRLSIDEAEVKDEENKLLSLWVQAAVDREKGVRRHARLGIDLPSSFAPLEVGPQSASASYSFGNAEAAKTMLDNTKKVASLDLLTVLQAHLKESVESTLMYNSNVTKTTR